MTHIKYASDGPRFQITNASIPRYSFKIHDTALQLHEWTRSEKMKLKEQAVAEMAKEKQAQAQGEKKALSAEAEVNETESFEGEMDNFQTPLVRCGLLVLFYVTYCPCTDRFAPPRRVSVFIQLSSLVPLVRLHSSIPKSCLFRRRSMADGFFLLNRICRTSFRSKLNRKEKSAPADCPFCRIIAARL
jgi:hypothetical protein